MPESYDVAIVGGGHNGLAAAAAIASAGHTVAVFERRAFVGGAVATEELVPGYRFSSCSYITHMLHEHVLSQLRIVEHLPSISPLGPSIDLLPDGRVFRQGATAEETGEAAAQMFGEPARAAFLRWDTRWGQAAAFAESFLFGAAPTVADLAERAEGEEAADTIALFARSSYRQLLEQSLPAEMRTALAPNLDGSMDIPGSPLTQAYYATERCRDMRYQGVPEGGMGAIADAFAAAARAAGADVSVGAPVAEILIRQGSAHGVRLETGRAVDARIVISNADPKRTLLQLIDAGQLAPQVRAAVLGLDSSPGGVKIHLALRRAPDLRRILGDREPEMLGFVNLFPVSDWYLRVPEEQTRGAFPRSAFLQLQIPTYVDRTLTRPGHHVISIFIPHVAPRLRKRSWAARRWDIAALTIRRVAEFVPNLLECLDGVVVFSPDELESRVGLTDGNIRHLAHRPGQAWAERPLMGWSDGSTPIENLYLCGAGVHPGGEVSGVPGFRVGSLVCARLAA